MTFSGVRVIPPMIHIFYQKNFLEHSRHYPQAQRALDSWKRYLPECKITLWHEDLPEFQQMLKSSRYLRACYRYRLWPQVADYVRAWVLFYYGGIYLDTDMVLLRNCEFLRMDSFFIFSVKLPREKEFKRPEFLPKDDFVIDPGMIGSVMGHPVLGEVLTIYNSEELFHSRMWIANSIFLVGLLRVAAQLDPSLIATGSFREDTLNLRVSRHSDIFKYASATSQALITGQNHISLQGKYIIYSDKCLSACDDEETMRRKSDHPACCAWHICRRTWDTFKTRAFVMNKHRSRLRLYFAMIGASLKDKIYSLHKSLKD